MGDQPTVSFNINMLRIAMGCSYAIAELVTTIDDLKNAIQGARSGSGASSIEVQVCPGNRADIGRYMSTPMQNKTAMMRFFNMEWSV